MAVGSNYSYLTVDKPAKGLFKEKGSKFISLVFPVESEVEIKTNLDQVQKEYFDARHHCYAWILGADKLAWRASDDGEPNHSAGDPILGQIKSKDLTNVLVIVVRYFGGIKLGVGGLISAYRAAAHDALQNAMIIEKALIRSIKLEFEYENTSDVMRLVKDFEMNITEQRYERVCQLNATFKFRYERKITEKLKLLNALGTRIVILT